MSTLQKKKRKKEERLEFESELWLKVDELRFPFPSSSSYILYSCVFPAVHQENRFCAHGFSRVLDHLQRVKVEMPDSLQDNK